MASRNTEVVLCERCWDFHPPGTRKFCGKCRQRLVHYSIPAGQMPFLYHRRLRAIGRKTDAPAGEDRLFECRGAC
jgi:hypothetical protein